MEVRKLMDKISILKTNMLMKSHWKVIKHDFLYKFFCTKKMQNLKMFIEQDFTTFDAHIKQCRRKFSHKKGYFHQIMHIKVYGYAKG